MSKRRLERPPKPCAKADTCFKLRLASQVPDPLRLPPEVRKISPPAVHRADEKFAKAFREHNDARSAHTSKFCPWILVAYFAFANRSHAGAFEKYLKSGSGRAFAKR